MIKLNFKNGILMDFSVLGCEKALAASIVSALKKWVSEPASSHHNSILDLNLAVSSLIIGDRQDRMGPKLSTRGHDSVLQKVSWSIQNKEPIKIYAMWGGIKHYVCLEKQSVDAAELFALIQFHRLKETIKLIYPPGISINIYLEDFGVIYEDTSDVSRSIYKEVVDAVDRYCSSFESLAKTILGNSVECLRFESVCPRNSWPSLVEQADRDFESLKEVWGLLTSHNHERIRKATTILEDIGWGGEIPEVMRSHYLQRLSSLYPEEEVELKTNRVLRYFTMVLTYQKGRFFTPEKPAVKFSMYLPSPGIPDDRIVERIHLRTLSKRLSTQTMPPWTCTGCFHVNDSSRVSIKIRSRKILSRNRTKTTPINIALKSQNRCIYIPSQILS